MKKVMLATVFTALLLGGCSNSSKDKAAESSSSSAVESSSVAESTVESSEETLATADLVYAIDGVENTVDPSKVSVNTGVKLNTDAYMELWVLSDTFENAGVVIYADGEQVGYKDESQLDTDTSSPITGDHIAEGLHSVELVQYADNDENSDIIYYVRTTYEIK